MKRSLLISGIVVGTLLTSAPLWGLLATVHGMNRAFTVLGSDGVANPQGLSTAIGGVLFSSVLSLIACPLGVLLLTLCIILLAVSKKPTPPPPPAPRSGITAQEPQGVLCDPLSLLCAFAVKGLLGRRRVFHRDLDPTHPARQPVIDCTDNQPGDESENPVNERRENHQQQPFQNANAARYQQHAEKDRE